MIRVTAEFDPSSPLMRPGRRDGANEFPWLAAHQPHIRVGQRRQPCGGLLLPGSPAPRQPPALTTPGARSPCLPTAARQQPGQPHPPREGTGTSVANPVRRPVRYSGRARISSRGGSRPYGGTHGAVSACRGRIVDTTGRGDKARQVLAGDAEPPGRADHQPARPPPPAYQPWAGRDIRTYECRRIRGSMRRHSGERRAQEREAWTIASTTCAGCDAAAEWLAST